MEYIFAIILGLIQGLTEFLPVSSSGHLLLFNELVSKSSSFIFMAILLHIATLIDVVIIFRKQILELIKKPFSKKALQLYISTILTVILVLIFENSISKIFNGKILPISFFITAILLITTQYLSNKKNTIKQSDFSYPSAIKMGIAQGLAIVPGLSRSGTTICTGLLCKENREETAEFSFLMSIPIIIGSLAYEILGAVKNGESLFQGNIIAVIIAFVVAFITGLFAIKIMLKVVQKASYFWFAIYLIALSIFSVVMFW